MGVVVILFAIGLIQHHRESFRAKFAEAGSGAPKADSEQSSQNELDFIRTRHRRRMIASSLMGTVGILFVVDSFVDEMFASVIMMMLILLLMPVLFIIAMFDFYRSQQHMRTEIKVAVDAKRTLIAEAERLSVSRSQHESHASESDSTGDVASPVDSHDSAEDSGKG